jgi:hypothetical protein
MRKPHQKFKLHHVKRIGNDLYLSTLASQRGVQFIRKAEVIRFEKYNVAS